MLNHCKLRIFGDAVFTLNMLSFNKIAAKRPVKTEGGVILYIKSQELKKAQKLFDDRGKKYEVLEDKSIKGNIKNNALRFGIYVGIMFAAIFMYYYANTVTRIEISGNKYVDTEKIYAAISEVAELPSFNNKPDTEAIKKSLIAIDGISSAAALVSGNTLFITVFEELPKVAVPDKTQYADIVSQYDCVILGIAAYSGTAAVKKGDTVKKGQTLIGAYTVIDEVKSKQYANGIAYGRVWMTKEVIISPTYVTDVRTGRSISKVRFFGSEGGCKPEFARYEVEKTDRRLAGTIPISYCIYTYHEIESVAKDNEFYTDTEAAARHYTEKYTAELPPESKLVRNWHDIKLLDKNIKLVIYYELEMKITN